MSNARIIERLEALANEVELGQVSVVELAAQLTGHTEALERVPYAQLKEAQMVRAQLEHAIGRGEGELVDVHRLGDWLREWTARVPSVNG